MTRLRDLVTMIAAWVPLAFGANLAIRNGDPFPAIVGGVITMALLTIAMREDR